MPRGRRGQQGKIAGVIDMTTMDDDEEEVVQDSLRSLGSESVSKTNVLQEREEIEKHIKRLESALQDERERRKAVEKQKEELITKLKKYETDTISNTSKGNQAMETENKSLRERLAKIEWKHRNLEQNHETQARIYKKRLSDLRREVENGQLFMHRLSSVLMCAPAYLRPDAEFSPDNIISENLGPSSPSKGWFSTEGMEPVVASNADVKANVSQTPTIDPALTSAIAAVTSNDTKVFDSKSRIPERPVFRGSAHAPVSLAEIGEMDTNVGILHAEIECGISDRLRWVTSKPTYYKDGGGSENVLKLSVFYYDAQKRRVSLQLNAFRVKIVFADNGADVGEWKGTKTAPKPPLSFLRPKRSDGANPTVHRFRLNHTSTGCKRFFQILVLYKDQVVVAKFKVEGGGQSNKIWVKSKVPNPRINLKRKYVAAEAPKGTSYATPPLPPEDLSEDDAKVTDSKPTKKVKRSRGGFESLGSLPSARSKERGEPPMVW
eukprot:g2626.t1